MTFNPDAQVDSSKASKTGRNTAIGVGGGGVVVLALLVVSQLLGVDLTGLAPALTGGDQSQQQGTDGGVDNCTTGQQANENVECRMAAAALVIDTYWAKELPELGSQYHSPGFTLFSGSTDTGCGAASSATGPFYCPQDETIYLDTSFYQELQDRFGSSGGPLAQMYVLAHEWGHHIQNITDINKNLNLQDTGPASDSVRLELQADCFAGAWVAAASTELDANGQPFLQPITQAQINDALSAASAVGDDHISEVTGTAVRPDTWTHGSSNQRQHWFIAGTSGGPNACNTFQVSGPDL
ncbi:MAG: neutral zinc metallopeptidase [Rhodoglobus sp.]